MGGADDYVTEVRQQRLLQWKGKALHGEFLKRVAEGGELSLSFKWLLYGRLKIPTEAQVWWLHKIRHWLVSRSQTTFFFLYWDGEKKGLVHRTVNFCSDFHPNWGG